MTSTALATPPVPDSGIAVDLPGAAGARARADELAAKVVEEGLREELVPSLARLDGRSQLGQFPKLIGELANADLDADLEPRSRRMLASLVREHAREREELGFGPREIVTEFRLLRRVMGRFLAQRAVLARTEQMLAADRRLDDVIDELVGESVAAYFDRVTADLAYRARADALTALLNHQAFSRQLQLELDRAKRYEHGLSLVFFDLDSFKRINDTLGHAEGDRVLRSLARLLREIVRGSDVAGRMGGDEFAVVLLETEPDAGQHFLARLDRHLEKRIADGELPAGFALSAGVAHYPTEGTDADALFRLADARLYAVKRSKQA